MPNTVKALIVFAALIGFIVIRQFHLSPETPPNSLPMREGSVVPPFQLEQWGGGKVSLQNLGAKVTLVNLWASWCDPCVRELPELKKLRQSFDSNELSVVLLNSDDPPFTEVGPLLEKLKIDFPTYLDRDGEFARLFEVQALPVTIIIDKNSTVLAIYVGERDWNDSGIRKQLHRWASL